MSKKRKKNKRDGKFIPARANDILEVGSYDDLIWLESGNDLYALTHSERHHFHKPFGAKYWDSDCWIYDGSEPIGGQKRPTLDYALGELRGKGFNSPLRHMTCLKLYFPFTFGGIPRLY